MISVIVGCGYTGEVLARRWVAAGHTVRATTTTEARGAALSALGVEPHVVRLDDEAGLRRVLDGAEVAVHLAPPDRSVPATEQVKPLVAAAGPLQALVYGSTTGAFGAPGAPDMWIDETTPPRHLGARGQARLDYEQALFDSGLPVRVVRIAGIYGPHRTLRRKLEEGRLVLFEGGPFTSRIHVEDLARLLAAMAGPAAPPMAVGCDDEPAPTLEVARYTCRLLGLPAPPVVSVQEAKSQLSPAALEMRMNGRRCRSLVRSGLIGDLEHPTYREGVRAALAAEGLTDPPSS